MIGVAHVQHALVEPRAHVVDARPGERFRNGRFDAGRVVGELNLGNFAKPFDAFAHLLLRRDAHDAVVREEHAALGGLRVLLCLREPLVDRRFKLRHAAPFLENDHIIIRHRGRLVARPLEKGEGAPRRTVDDCVIFDGAVAVRERG